MEVEFKKIEDVNCKTYNRVTNCIGYNTNLCEGICNFAKIYDRFHSAKSGMKRFIERYPEYELFVGSKV